VDVSYYAIEHAMEDIQSRVQVADARNLPFADNSFDIVILINTIHNLERDEWYTVKTMKKLNLA